MHLGSLGRYLRLLGFDTLFDPALDDDELATISRNEERILLTRDRGLLKRSMVTHGYCVRSLDPRTQLREIFDRFDLKGPVKPFSRCASCNGAITPVPKAAVESMVPPKIREVFDRFAQCADCGKIYWKGSHFDAMGRFFEEILTPGSEGVRD